MIVSVTALLQLKQKIHICCFSVSLFYFFDFFLRSNTNVIFLYQYCFVLNSIVGVREAAVHMKFINDTLLFENWQRKNQKTKKPG